MLPSILLVYTFAPPTPAFYASPALLQNHIHSPHQFLPAHGLCAPDFSLDTVHALRVHAGGSYQSVDIDYTTPLEGAMRARVFTDRANESHFVLFNSENEPTMSGRLRVTPLDRGWALRVEATLHAPPPLGLRAPYALPKDLEALLLVQAACPDRHLALRAYRSNLLLAARPRRLTDDQTTS